MKMLTLHCSLQQFDNLKQPIKRSVDRSARSPRERTLFNSQALLNSVVITGHRVGGIIGLGLSQ